MTMVASSLDAKVVLGGVTKHLFLLSFGHFGFWNSFLNHILRLEIGDPMSLKHFKKLLVYL
jgi:hypothetical protein